MTNLTLRLLFIPCFVLLLASMAPKIKAQSIDKVFFETESSLSKLADAIYSTEELPLIQNYKVLEQNCMELFVTLKKSSSINLLQEQYLNSLNHSQIAINELSVKIEDNQHAIQIIKAISKDYEIKKLSASNGITSTIGSSIKVTVESIGGTGYTVFVKYTYDIDKNIIRHRFNNPTNHAHKKLAPGYYIFWIEKGELKSEERIIELVSSESDNDEKIIFNVE